MSKINEALVSPTGNRFPTYSRGIALYSAQDVRPHPMIGLEYKLELRIGTIVRVPDDKLLLLMMKQARLSLINHVFGEFRPQINKIREAILDYDVEAALKELSTLEDHMFCAD